MEWKIYLNFMECFANKNVVKILIERK